MRIFAVLVTLLLSVAALATRPSLAQGTPAEADAAELAKLNEQFGLLYEQARYRDAIAVVEKALAIRKRQVGADHQDVGNLLVNLGELHRLAGDLQQAEPLFLQALAILEKALGPAHPMVATVLNNLGALHLQLGDLAGAEPYLRKAMIILENVLGPDDPNVQTLRLNLAQVLGARGDLDGAEALDRQAIARLEKRGPDDPMLATGLNNLAAVLLQKADFAQALPLMQRVVKMMEKAHGPNHPQVAVACNNLAEGWAARGEPGQAQPLYERALQILQAKLGAKHPDVAQILSNLGQLYAARGDKGRARAYHDKALEVREAALGPEHPAVAESLNVLGVLALQTGIPGEALPKLERALAIRRKALGPAHALVAQTENNVGSALRRLGRGAEAVKLFTLALTHWQAALGADHPDVANAMNNLGMVQHAEGKYAAARLAHQGALALRSKRLGLEHPLVASSLGNLSGAEQALGLLPEAIKNLSKAMTIREHELRRVLASGTAEQRALAVLAHAADIHRAVSLHLREAPKDANALRLALTVILQRKARGLDAAVDGMDLLRRSLAPQDQGLLTRLQEVEARIGALFQQGSGKMGAQAYGKLLGELHLEADGIEQQLASRSPALQETIGEVTIERVQAALPAGAHLVELIQWIPLDVKAKGEDVGLEPKRYAAYVLAKSGPPQAVDLGEAEPIDALARQLREALANQGRHDAQDLARHLDAKLLQPLQNLLGAGGTVLVAPDGPLHLVPFAALRAPDGQWRVQRFLFVNVSSGRELLRHGKSQGHSGPPVVIGAPDYGVAAAGPGGQAGRQGGLQFAALPGTADEAVSLSKLLPGAQVWTGLQASEAAMHGLHGPRILHVATHGFFLPERAAVGQAAGSRGGTRGSEALGEPDVTPAPTDLPDPYLRSGLALAGANSAQGTGGDGLLNASEASLLDLRGTKLVVLSACETGIGAVAGAEGVVGLRRALVLAGAESLVMSLWKVDDAATRDLMVAFYRKLQAGAGRADALRQAQLQLLGTGEHAHPFFWAAFIAVGDWRPLQ